MDFLLSEKDASLATQTAMRGGLAWLDTECRRRFNKTFVQSSDAQRRQVLDDIAYPMKARARDELRRVVLQPLPRHDGVRLLLQRHGLERRAIHRQRLQSGLRRMPARGPRQTRRQLRHDEKPHRARRTNEPRMQRPKVSKRRREELSSDQNEGSGASASDSSAAASTRASTCRHSAPSAMPTFAASGVRRPPTPKSAAALARELDIGAARAYRSITDMVSDPAIDAIWLTGPNHARIENVEEIVHAVKSGKGELAGLACEKPLARTVAEASRVVSLVKGTDIKHGYLENQVFAPQVEHGAIAALDARRRDHRPSLPCARRRRAQRTAHAVVLAR